MKHTPGPWQILARAADFYVTYSAGDIRSHIATCYHSTLAPEHGSLEANARLISAAPELLAACEMLMRYDSTVPEGPSGEIADGQKLIDAIRMAARAIAKAKGQP